MAEIHYAIKFGAKGSGKKYLGQQDVFPIGDAFLADGGRSYSGYGDRKGSTSLDTSYFTLPSPLSSTIDEDEITNFKAYLDGLVKNKVSPDTITVYEITTSDDPANYKVNRSAEHKEARIGIAGEDGNAYIIISDKATLSTIPEGGEEATNKTEIDFVNRRINGK